MMNDIGLLILRVSIGGLMLFAHGWGKLQNFAMIADRFPDPIGLGPTVSLTLAVFAEVFCSAAVILGLATRWAAIPLFVTMSVAAFIVHANDPFQKVEFALLYWVAFLTLMCTGGGRFSVDGVWATFRRKR